LRNANKGRGIVTIFEFASQDKIHEKWIKAVVSIKNHPQSVSKAANPMEKVNRKNKQEIVFMKQIPALFVSKEAVKSDSALAAGARGARKLMVTGLRENNERSADKIVWEAPTSGEKCAVLPMANAEIAVFNQNAAQIRHCHEKGTEIYMVMEGQMTMDVDDVEYLMREGDMMVVHPGTVHNVKPGKSGFLCRVVTINCGGGADKIVKNESTPLGFNDSRLGT
jgi:mannose-6-phosphate isomerase-like protein (cupin superfamily)